MENKYFKRKKWEKVGNLETIKQIYCKLMVDVMATAIPLLSSTETCDVPLSGMA